MSQDDVTMDEVIAIGKKLEAQQRARDQREADIHNLEYMATRGVLFVGPHEVGSLSRLLLETIRRLDALGARNPSSEENG